MSPDQAWWSMGLLPAHWRPELARCRPWDWTSCQGFKGKIKTLDNNKSKPNICSHKSSLMCRLLHCLPQRHRARGHATGRSLLSQRQAAVKMVISMSQRATNHLI
jgi:hypothetical protein